LRLPKAALQRFASFRGTTAKKVVCPIIQKEEEEEEEDQDSHHSSRVSFFFEFSETLTTKTLKTEVFERDLLENSSLNNNNYANQISLQREREREKKATVLCWRKTTLRRRTQFLREHCWKTPLLIFNSD